ncbi:Segregation and condensation protein B [Candidatus Phaeomarinobacter ectocarpi]|uniref:Segregation and condensation protein B n=1 Tax=Candidatus Phaeomarinibacter ectocarpi TaxID=1458461 RepID=X5MPB0_9HYPH|nr:Segregation and condensation protein B [Candidatus Phaeomarinobacter ectocarpi]
MTNAPRRAEKHDMHEEDDIEEEAVGSETEAADTASSEAEASNEDAADTSNVASISDENRAKTLRMVEALLFAASEPLDVKSLAQRLPEGTDVPGLLTELQAFYAPRGVNLVPVGGKWLMRTAEDLSFLLQREAVQMKKLSRPAMETLAIIAYHQPVTRAEIEEIRGVSVSTGTLDVLLETGWIRLRGRRKTPGRPLTYGTSEDFLVHFGLESVRDLPGVDDLKAAGLLDARLPPDFSVPQPGDDQLSKDEEELAEDDSGEELLIGEASDEVIPEPVASTDDETTSEAAEPESDENRE